MAQAPNLKDTPKDLFSGLKIGKTQLLAQLCISTNPASTKGSQSSQPTSNPSHSGKMQISVIILRTSGEAINLKVIVLRVLFCDNEEPSFLDLFLSCHSSSILTKCGLDVNTGDQNGKTALHLAAEKGHQEVVSALVDAGCPIDVVDNSDSSALHWAAVGGAVRDRMISFLIDGEHFYVNSENKDGAIPLHAACFNSQPQAAFELLRHRAHLTKVAGRYGTPLHQAAVKGGRASLIDDILKFQSEQFKLYSGSTTCNGYHQSPESTNPLDVCDSFGRTPAFVAVAKGCFANLETLVANNCDIRVRSNTEFSIFEYAIEKGQMSQLQAIANACRVDACNTSQIDLLLNLQANDLLDSSKLLVLGAIGGDPLVIDILSESSEKDWFTAAAHQVWSDTYNCRIVLLEVNFCYNDKYFIYDSLCLPSACALTPLQIAVIFLKYRPEYYREENTRIVQTLAEFIQKLIIHPVSMFTVNIQFHNGLSPLDVAQQFGLHDIADMIDSARGSGPGMWADLPKEGTVETYSSQVKILREANPAAMSRIVEQFCPQLARERILDSKPQLETVIKHILPNLKHVKSWFEVAVQLGVRVDMLTAIEKGYGAVQTAYRKLVTHSLEHGSQVSWESLFDVVGTFETDETVREIRAKILEELQPSAVCSEDQPATDDPNSCRIHTEANYLKNHEKMAFSKTRLVYTHQPLEANDRADKLSSRGQTAFSGYKNKQISTDVTEICQPKSSIQDLSSCERESSSLLSVDTDLVTDCDNAPQMLPCPKLPTQQSEDSGAKLGSTYRPPPVGEENPVQGTGQFAPQSILSKAGGTQSGSKPIAAAAKSTKNIALFVKHPQSGGQSLDPSHSATPTNPTSPHHTDQFQAEVSDYQLPTDATTDDIGESVLVTAGADCSRDFHSHDHCLEHTSTTPTPAYTNQTALVRGIDSALFSFKMIKTAVEECTELSLKPDVFLSALNLHRILTKNVTTTDFPNYLFKCSKLEFLYKEIENTPFDLSTTNNSSKCKVLLFDRKAVDRILSCFKWLDDEDKKRLKKELLKTKRDGWNAIKNSIEAVDMVHIPNLASKLGLQFPLPNSRKPAIDEFLQVLTELDVAYKKWGACRVSKSQIILALQSSSASLQLLDAVLSQGLVWTCQFVQSSDAVKYASLLCDTKERFSGFLDVILDDVTAKLKDELSQSLRRLPPLHGSVQQCLVAWLAVRTEVPEGPVTWDNFVEMVKSLGQDATTIVSDQRDYLSSIRKSAHLQLGHGVSEQPQLYQSKQEQEPHPVAVGESKNGSGRAKSSSSSHTQSSGYESLVESLQNSNWETNEEKLLTDCLNLGNPFSIIAHAKEYYLTGDFSLATTVLGHLDHHLSVDGRVVRAKYFGIGVCHYRQRQYSKALENFNRLKDASIKTASADIHSRGDLTSAYVYLGETYFAQNQLERAHTMYMEAKKIYSGSDNTVAHLLGAFMQSKSAILTKAGTCLRLLHRHTQAESILDDAVSLASEARNKLDGDHLTLEASKKLREVYRDEVSARTSLGNLHQILGKYSQASSNYRITLDLQSKLDSDCLHYSWAQGNLGNSLINERKVSEAIPHLKSAYALARKFERHGSDIARTANNLGNAYQISKEFDQAEEYYQISLGHSVFCRDTAGHARSLGNLGNVRILQGKHKEAIRIFTEAIDLDYERDINITAYQNRAGAYIQLAKEVSGGSEWEPVSQHVQSLEPSGMQSFGMPVQECTQSHHLENKRLALVAPTGSYTQLPLDDSADILTKQQPLPAVPPTTSAAPSRDREDVRKGPGLSLMPPLEDLNPSYRKYYLEQARDDLSTSLSLIESQFKEMQQDISSLRALSPFDAHSNGFYTLQKVLVLLGDHQGSLRVAEQNRARNIGVALSSKRQPALPRVVQNNPGGPSPTNPSPFGLDELWEAVSREKVPVIMLSYIQDDATIFAHLVVPYDSQKLEEDSGRLTSALSHRSDDSGIAKSFSSNIDSSVSSRFSLESTSSRSTTSISTASSDDLLIPPPYYHFMQISVEKESFVNKQYNSLAYTNTDGPIPFHEYIIKTLINYMNQKELDLFHPIDFQDNDSPLTIIFEKLAHVFVEEIEKRCPDVREFVVIADKASHFIPWPLLQSERDKVFLGDKYRVRTYPSLHSMGIMNSQPTKEIALPSQERFLVIGNPSIPSFKLAGQEHTLGRLQHAESEAFSVSHFLETSPLVKEMATKPTVLFRLERSQIVHIATHASAVGGYLAFACSVPVVGTNNPVEAKETLMFINEIQSLNISASLVVLSACDSARGELVNDGVNSLANAFLTAGAESVLVSLVRVPDKSASIFMSSFYRFLTHHGVTTSEAIQKSSMIIRCIRSLSQHVHWGGYRLLGRDIRMRYDPTCPAARVAGLLGETSAFPRLKLLKELEKAIFRQDRSPPRDVVIVKGMAAYEPAEVVRDFVAKRFSHFPGGILWYNCASPQLLEASIQSAKEALSKLKNLPTVPPSDSQYSGTHSKLDSSPHFTDHFKLVILDSPYNFQDCVRKITSSQDITQHDVDIIVIGSLETDTDKSLSLFADSELIRGCTHVEVGDLDRYASIQRMAYNLLSKQHFCPYEDDYFAFETLTKFCRGSATVVKVFEGLLATSESDSDTNIVRSLAQDIDRTKDLVCIYGDEEVTAATQPATATSSWTALSVASAILQTGKKLVRLGRETKKAEHHVRNGLITDATARRLSNEDCVMLSDGLEKLSRLMDSMSNFLTLEVSPDAHFILQCLSYLSIPDAHDVHSESTFTFPECFLTQIAICVAHTNKSLSAHKLLSELKGMNLLRRYPQPLLAPPEQTDSECLFYVPDLIVRCVTYDMDDADRAFGLTVMSQAFDYIPTPSPLDYSVTAVDDRLKQLFRNEGLYRQTSKFPWPSSETFRLTFTEPQISHLPKVGEKSMVRSSDSPNYPPL